MAIQKRRPGYWKDYSRKRKAGLTGQRADKSGCVKCLSILGYSIAQILKQIRVHKKQVCKYRKLIVMPKRKKLPTNKLDDTIKQERKIKAETEKKWRKAKLLIVRNQKAMRMQIPTVLSSGKTLKQARQYYHSNKDRIWAKAKLNKGYMLSKALRVRLYKFVKRKHATFHTILGCDRVHLMEWIQGQFTPEMNWNNYGSVWHIDHIRPCASFCLTDPIQVMQCFHFTNLAPLDANANRRKSSWYQGVAHRRGGKKATV